jgi:hypothetical protein
MEQCHDDKPTTFGGRPRHTPRVSSTSNQKVLSRIAQVGKLGIQKQASTTIVIVSPLNKKTALIAALLLSASPL